MLLLNNIFLSFLLLLKREKKSIKLNYSFISSNDLIELIYLIENKNHAFFIKFSSVYSPFLKRINTKHPEINKNELEVCAYIILNYSTKDIARYTKSSVRSIESKKYRIRKKLNINSDKVLDSSILLNI